MLDVKVKDDKNDYDMGQLFGEVETRDYFPGLVQTKVEKSTNFSELQLIFHGPIKDDFEIRMCLVDFS